MLLLLILLHALVSFIHMRSIIGVHFTFPEARYCCTALSVADPISAVDFSDRETVEHIPLGDRPRRTHRPLLAHRTSTCVPTYLQAPPVLSFSGTPLVKSPSSATPGSSTASIVTQRVGAIEESAAFALLNRARPTSCCSSARGDRGASWALSAMGDTLEEAMAYARAKRAEAGGSEDDGVGGGDGDGGSGEGAAKRVRWQGC